MGFPEKICFGNFKILSAWYDHLLLMTATPKDYNKNGERKPG
jgi:hypothetical protein